MSHQSSTKKPNTLNKLARLYELRQNKAGKQYQQQQATLADAQAKFDQRESDHLAVGNEAERLAMAAESEELASNVRAQQQMQIKRKWLQYDSQKTEYFLNDARSDLETEQQEADRQRSEWMQLRTRHDEFQNQHRAAIKGVRNTQLMLEECEQEEDALGRASGMQHHG